MTIKEQIRDALSRLVYVKSYKDIEKFVHYSLEFSEEIRNTNGEEAANIFLYNLKFWTYGAAGLYCDELALVKQKLESEDEQDYAEYLRLKSKFEK